MAKKGGGFGKVLEFIGLVDDEDPQDYYEDEYQSGNYGRQPVYTPQRQQPRQQPQRQTAMTTRRAPSYAPTRAPRMERNASRSRFDAPQRGNSAPSRRAESQHEPRQSQPSRYDYSPRSSRFGSLEDSPADASQSAPQRSSSRQRTVMFSLRNLEDCCDVIDNLILNNTVVLTMDDLDARLMQRAVDTLSGAVFALHATIRKASEHTYLIAPSGVEVNETYDTDSRY